PPRSIASGKARASRNTWYARSPSVRSPAGPRWSRPAAGTAATRRSAEARIRSSRAASSGGDSRVEGGGSAMLTGPPPRPAEERVDDSRHRLRRRARGSRPAAEAVARSLDGQERGRRGDQNPCGVELLERAERVARAVGEQRGAAEPREV